MERFTCLFLFITFFLNFEILVNNIVQNCSTGHVVQGKYSLGPPLEHRDYRFTPCMDTCPHLRVLCCAVLCNYRLCEGSAPCLEVIHSACPQ
jgi:hypothetical protein